MRPGDGPSTIYSSSSTIRILGADPGAPAGIAAVEFVMRGKDRTPQWQRAHLLIAGTLGKPSNKYANEIEGDILHASSMRSGLEKMHRGSTLLQSEVDIIAVEEPGDARSSWKGAQGQEGKQRAGTGFRLGVHYRSLVSALYGTYGSSAAYISYPVTSTKGRRGWMRSRTTRETTLQAADTIMRSICTAPQYAALPLNMHTGLPVDHILMAIGVINHTVEYFSEYFPCAEIANGTTR